MAAAGVIEWIERTQGVGPEEDPVRHWIGSWTADSNGAAAGATPVINGVMQAVRFVPLSPQPTGGHTIVAHKQGASSVDYFGGRGSSLSATAETQDTPLGPAGFPVPIDEALNVAVSGTAAGSKGEIHIYAR